MKTAVPLDALNSTRPLSASHIDNQPMQMWPWTVSLNGTTIWFDTPDQAASFVFRNFKRGSRDFEIGCFQFSYRSHSQSFASIEQMFDADKNALEAARSLKNLYARSGDWTQAATDFHLNSLIPSDTAHRRTGAATLRFATGINASSALQQIPQGNITLVGPNFDEAGG